MIYTITKMRDPTNYDQQSAAIEMLHQYGKVSRERSFLIVKESLTAYKRSEPVNIEVDIPDTITPGCMRELELYFNFTQGKMITPPKTLKIKLIQILNGVKLDAARRALFDYAELDDSHAIFIVGAVSGGISTTIKVRYNISTGAVRKLRDHFELITVNHHGNMSVKQSDNIAGKARRSSDTVQLKLWTVNYHIKGNPLEITALILAETSAYASEALTKAIPITEILMVTEVEGPFANGYLLTRSMVAF